MLDIVIGKKFNTQAADRLLQQFRTQDWNGTLYIGYPIIPSIDQPIYLEALLTCSEHGIVIFDFPKDDEIDDIRAVEEKQDDLYFALSQKLNTVRALRRGRALTVDINIVSLISHGSLDIANEQPIVTTPESVLKVVEAFDELTNEDLVNVNAAIQQITTIKPLNKRSSVQRVDSRGAIIKTIEREIANLDRTGNISYKIALPAVH